jgi:hypothetical protein
MGVNGWQLSFSERFGYSRFNDIVLPLQLTEVLRIVEPEDKRAIKAHFARLSQQKVPAYGPRRAKLTSIPLEEARLGCQIRSKRRSFCGSARRGRAELTERAPSRDWRGRGTQGG